MADEIPMLNIDQVAKRFGSIPYAIIGGSGSETTFGSDELKHVANVHDTGNFDEPPAPFSVYRDNSYGDGDKSFLLAVAKRHGTSHGKAPHDVNYRGMIWLMKKIGVTDCVSTSAVGYLTFEDYTAGRVRRYIRFMKNFGIDNEHDPVYGLPGFSVGEACELVEGRNDDEVVIPGLQVGDFVVPSDVFSFPLPRDDSFVKNRHVHHRDGTLVCPTARNVLLNTARPVVEKNERRLIAGGDVATIQGPGFSTRAQSRVYRELLKPPAVIGMTFGTEASLLREINVRTVGLSYCTDGDNTPIEAAGVSQDDVSAVAGDASKISFEASLVYFERLNSRKVNGEALECLHPNTCDTAYERSRF